MDILNFGEFMLDEIGCNFGAENYTVIPEGC
jgi:hypothetical protein